MAEHRLPRSAEVTTVEVAEDRIALRTTLTDRTQAAELWEGLSRVIGCDDSYLLIKGHSVVLANGGLVTAPRPGSQPCVECCRAAPAPSRSTPSSSK